MDCCHINPLSWPEPHVGFLSQNLKHSKGTHSTSLHNPFSSLLGPTTCCTWYFATYKLYTFYFCFCVCFILYFLIFVCFIALPTSFLLTFTLDGYIGRHSKADDASYFINVYTVFWMWKGYLLPSHAVYNFSCIKVYNRLMVALKAETCSRQ